MLGNRVYVPLDREIRDYTGYLKREFTSQGISTEVMGRLLMIKFHYLARVEELFQLFCSASPYAKEVNGKEYFTPDFFKTFSRLISGALEYCNSYPGTKPLWFGERGREGLRDALLTLQGMSNLVYGIYHLSGEEEDIISPDVALHFMQLSLKGIDVHLSSGKHIPSWKIKQLASTSVDELY